MGMERVELWTPAPTSNQLPTLAQGPQAACGTHQVEDGRAAGGVRAADDDAARRYHCAGGALQLVAAGAGRASSAGRARAAAGGACQASAARQVGALRADDRCASAARRDRARRAGGDCKQGSERGCEQKCELAPQAAWGKDDDSQGIKDSSARVKNARMRAKRTPTAQRPKPSAPQALLYMSLPVAQVPHKNVDEPLVAEDVHALESRGEHEAAPLPSHMSEGAVSKSGGGVA